MYIYKVTKMWYDDYEIVESETRPEECPLCKAPGEKFVEVKEEGLTETSSHRTDSSSHSRCMTIPSQGAAR